MCFWNAMTPQTVDYSCAQLTGNVANQAGVCVGEDATTGGHGLCCTAVAGSAPAWRMTQIVNGVGTTITSGTTPVFSLLDYVGIRRTATNMFQCYRSTTGNSWTALGTSQMVTGVPDPGRFGAYAEPGSSFTLETWEGGNGALPTAHVCGLPGGAFAWQKNLAGSASGDNQLGLGIATDTSGNVAVTGDFTGTGQFGGGPLTTGPGQTQVFVTDFDTSGTFRWAKAFGGNFDQYGEAAATDASGNVFITGRFSTTIDFGGGTLTSLGSFDVFVAKFSSTGTLLWQIREGGTNWDEGTSIAVDASGNVLVGGIFAGTANFGGSNFTSAGSFDGFLAKYDGTTGAHIWSKAVGGTSGDFINAIGVDSSGNVTAVGYFSGITNMGGGPLVSAGSNDVFVARFSSAGAPLFSQRYGGTGDERAFGCAVDASGNVVLTGYFVSTIDFGGGTMTNFNGADIFLAKLTGPGGFVWQKQFASSVAISPGEIGKAVRIVAGSGDIVLTGQIVGNVNFGGGDLIGPTFTADVFLAKFTSAGAYKWAQRYFGAFDDTGSAVAVDSSGDVYATGNYGTDAAYKGFGGGTMNGPGAHNGFVVKLGP